MVRFLSFPPSLLGGRTFRTQWRLISMSIARETPASDVPAISKIEPIRVWDHAEGRGTWVLPALSHTEAIPTLWKILDLIRSDWTEAAAALSIPDNCTDISSKACFHLDALEYLKPRFIQCLFSYINFFFTLENGFQVLLSELGDLNHELGLKLKIPKSPKRPPYIEKIWLVRNHTVVHWGGPGKKHELDSRAGRLWGFSWPGDRPDEPSVRQPIVSWSSGSCFESYSGNTRFLYELPQKMGWAVR